MRRLRAGLLPVPLHCSAAEGADPIPEVARLRRKSSASTPAIRPATRQTAEFEIQIRTTGIRDRYRPHSAARQGPFHRRLRGDGSKRPVLIAAHEDVGGGTRKWSLDPFAGVIKDGCVYAAAPSISKAASPSSPAVLDIARQAPTGATSSLAEADEEGGAYGTRFRQRRPGKRSIMNLLNEGGWIIQTPPAKCNTSASPPPTNPASLVLTARGTSTHSPCRARQRHLYLARAGQTLRVRHRPGSPIPPANSS